MFYFHIFSLFISVTTIFANSHILSKEDFNKAQLFTSTSLLKEGVKEQRWVCTKVGDKVFIKCDDLGINKLEGPKRELQINIKSKEYIHEYGLRHGILKRECERMKHGIHRLLAQDKTVCFRGQFASADFAHKPVLFGWVFDEVKSNSETLCEFNDC